MRRRFMRIAAAGALVVATAAFTGTALADGGHGNSANAPGHAKASQAQSSSEAPQQQSGSTDTAGQKPGKGTGHWTHTTVGASPDVSKRYGNGKTAAEIAASRGAPASQPLTGPGNSQPHKTFSCAHKDNRSGGVDVHAIKSYSASSCQTQQVQEQKQQLQQEKQKQNEQEQLQQQTEQEQQQNEQTQLPQANEQGAQKVTICHATGSATNPYVEITVDEHALVNGHTADKGDIIPAPATGCPAAAVSSQVQVEENQSQSGVSAESNAQAGNNQSVLGTPAASNNTPVQAAAAAPTGQGQVLGAQATLTKKPASHHGVLGALGRVAGTTLPFTGFPVWAALLAALALIGGGLVLRRRASAWNGGNLP